MRAIVCLVLAAVLGSAADPLAQVFDKAVAALSTRDYATAEAGFQQVLKTSPNHIGALGNLDVVDSRTARVDKALVVYNRAVRPSPGAKELVRHLGSDYVQ